MFDSAETVFNYNNEIKYALYGDSMFISFWNKNEINTSTIQSQCFRDTLQKRFS